LMHHRPPPFAVSYKSVGSVSRFRSTYSCQECVRNSNTVHFFGGVGGSTSSVRFFANGAREAIASFLSKGKEVSIQLKNEVMDCVPIAKKIAASGETSLTRAEFRKLRRTRQDLLSIGLFAILPELIPLALFFWPHFLPHAIRNAFQQQKQLAKRMEQRAVALAQIHTEFEDIVQRAHNAHPLVPRMTSASVLDRLLEGDSSSTVVVYVRDTLQFNKIPWRLRNAMCSYLLFPLSWTAPMIRLQRGLDFLMFDDKQIQKEGGLSKLSEAAVEEVFDERGLTNNAKSQLSQAEQFKATIEWLQISLTQKTFPPAMLLLIPLKFHFYKKSGEQKERRDTKTTQLR